MFGNTNTLLQSEIPVGTIPVSGLNDQANLYGVKQVQNQRKNLLIKMFDNAYQHKQTHHKRWKENYEYYFGIDREIKARADFQSKIFVPRPYLVVETKTPKMVQNLLSKDPIFTVKPQSKDDELKARVSSELISWQLRNHENIIQELTVWFKDSFIYGGAIGKTGWKFCRELQTRRQPMGPTMDPISGNFVFQEEVTQEYVTTVDRPYFKNVDIGSIFPDPQASSIEDCKFIIEQNMVSIQELKYLQEIGMYQYVDLIQSSRSTGYIYDDFANRRFSVHNLNDPYSPPSPVYDLVELLEFWWIDPETRQKRKTVLANRDVIVQDIEYPYWHFRWPYYRLTDIPMTKEFWGMGEIDPIKDLVKEKNELRNQQNDNRNQLLKAFWVVDRNANIDIEELINMPPGGILEVNGNPANGIQILRPPQLDSMTFGAEAQIDSDIQITSGANDIAIGQSTRSQVRNATTGSLLAQSTDTRYGLTALLYLEEIRKIGRDWLSLNQQFMTQPVMVRVLGQDGVNLMDWYATPYDIPQQYDLYVASGSEFQGDKDVQKQQSMQLFSILANIPGFNITEYAKEIMYLFDQKNPERFFEGSFVVPTQQIMQAMGIGAGGNPINSSYMEQMGGLLGGGMQSNPRAKIPGALNQADTLQYAKNPTGAPNGF